MKPPATPEGACHSPTRPSSVGGAAGLHQGACSPARVTAGREGAALAHAAPPLFPRMIEYKLDLLDELIEHLGEDGDGLPSRDELGAHG